MNAGKQATWLFIALISLCFSSWYFASSSNIAKLDEKTLSTTVDTIIKNLTVKQYDTAGNLVNYLKTPLLHHTPKDNIHWLKNPFIQVSQQDQTPWEISAKVATSMYGAE